MEEGCERETARSITAAPSSRLPTLAAAAAAIAILYFAQDVFLPFAIAVLLTFALALLFRFCAGSGFHDCSQ